MLYLNMKTIIAILLTLQLAAQDEYVRMEPKPFDWTKTACLTYFGAGMGGMFLLNRIPEDKLHHDIAGWSLGVLGNVAGYQITKRKWPAFIFGVGLSTSFGLGKEYLYDKNVEGHTVSWKDAAHTIAFGVLGSIGATWYLDKPRKNKPIYNP